MAIDNDNMSRAAKVRSTTYGSAVTKNQILPFLLSSRPVNLRRFVLQTVATVTAADWVIQFGNTVSSTAYGTLTIANGVTAGTQAFAFPAGTVLPANTAFLYTSTNPGGNGNGYAVLEFDYVDDVPQVVN